MKKTFWLVERGRGAPVPRAGSKHHELQSIGRFWYREIRDFLIPGCTIYRRSV